MSAARQPKTTPAPPKPSLPAEAPDNIEKQTMPYVELGLPGKREEAFPLAGQRYLDLADIALGVKKSEPRRTPRPPKP